MLRVSAVALAGGAAGALTAGRIETATATETDLSVEGDEVLLRGESVASVWLDIALGWAYAVPNDESPDELVLEITAGEDQEVVASHSKDAPFLEGEGEQTFEVDLLDTAVFDVDDLVPDEAGETVSTTIDIGAELRLYDTDGFVVAADGRTDEATIVIERDEFDPNEHGAIAGAGAITVELSD